MKSQSTIFLSLQRLCNLRCKSGILGKCSLAGLLMLTFTLLPFQNAKADYFYEYSNYFTVTPTAGNEGGALDIHLIGLDKNGDNDKMSILYVYFSTDNGTTWNPICFYRVDNENLTGNTFTAWASINKNSINYNLGFIENRGVAYPTGSLQAYIDLRWYFPDKIKGKKILIGIKGAWLRNYATSSPSNDPFDCVNSSNSDVNDNFTYTRREIQLFDYSTQPVPTCSIVPKVDGNFNLKWDKAGNYLSKIKVFSESYATPKDSVKATTATGEASVQLGLFNSENAYTLKKVYETPKDVSGFSVRYEQNIGKVSHAGYSYPSNLNANLDPCTKKATLTWQNTNPLNYDINSKLYIYRKLSTQSFYTLVNTTGLGVDRVDFTDPEELQFDKTYTYIVRSYANIFDISNSVLTSEKADTLLPELLSKTELNTQRQVIKFDGFYADALMPSGNVPAKVVVNWLQNWCSDNTKNIKIHKYNTVSKVSSVISVLSKELKYEDLDVINEVPYDYRLELDNAGVIVYSPWDTANVVEDKAQFVRFNTTKGVYNDRIKLLWEIDKPLLNTKYIVHRKAYGDSIFSVIYEKESQNRIENWEDLSVSPGILYQYQIESYYVTSTNKIKRSFTSNSLGLGFCQPAATVSGSITFGSGTCVENVNVSIENNDLSQQLYSCINFKDQDTKRGEGNIEFQKLKHGCIHTGFTWQAWVKPQNRSQNNAVIYELENEYSIRMNGNTIEVYNGSDVTSTKLLDADISTISTSEFFQLSVVCNPTTKIFEIYINGELKNSSTYDMPACPNADVAKAKLAASFDVNLNHFKGSIDEMRLWNRPLTATEVSKNFDRYLSGTETDLVGYWQMDEGIDMYAFDRSNKSRTYNEHHITLSSASTSSVVPTTSQLSIKATTDKNGNYIIQGVPYKGNGSSYHVTPIFGTHTFQPASQLIFIGGASSEVQSAVNFKDVSSFTIKGRILYENTDYPVEDVEFLVDGNVCMRNYKKQVTDANGDYEIDVPIGEHIITPVKNGHVFADAYAYATLKMGLKYNFNVNKTNIDFVDQTKVTLVGRVTGGNVQETKPVGFNRSKANIGSAEVRLQPKQKQKYTLNKTLNDSLIYDSNDKDIKSTAKVKRDDDIIRIVTDPDNGEFSVKVPPVPMLVTSVSAGSLVSSDFKYENLPSVDMNPLISSVDTIHTGIKVVDGISITAIDSCKYNQRLNITYISPKAEFIIRDRNYSWKAFGDSLYNYVDPNNPAANKTLSMVTRNDDGNPVYLANYPVFTQGNYYTFDIVAYEKYINPNTNDSDFVYLKNALFSIENKLSTKTEKTVFTLDSLGRFTYKFMAGNPDIISPYTKGLTAAIEHNYAVEAWTRTLNAIVTGAVPVGGVDFITKGPDQVIAVLRDPPGSNSYATLEKGSSVSSTKSYKGVGKESSGHKFIANLGGEQSIGLGLIIETKNKYDLGAGIEQSVEGSDATSRNESYSFSESISTSSSTDYIGANGDLYIANSSNIGFAKCNQLSFSSTGSVQLGSSYIFVPMGDTTAVRYTQSHIVNTLLPKIKELRNSLLDTTSMNTTPGIKSKYYTTKSILDDDFGANGTYTWIQPAIVEGVCIDSVMFYNNQISNWEKLIRDNEMEKLYASGKSPVGNTSTIKYNMKNISFDAGAILSNSYTRTSNCTTTNNVTWELQAVFSADMGLTVGGFGFSLENEIKTGGGEEKTTEDLTENTVTYSYNLEDGDAGNYFSVDVFTPKSYTVTPKAKVDMNKEVKSFAVSDVEHEGGPIFVTRGGNSSCPYEGEDMSLFYKNSSGKQVALNTATVQIEKPGINVLVPSVTGVTSGRQATYEVDLQNYSETSTSTWFQLSVDPASNPHGAIISIDGTPLTEPRLFLIPPKQAVRKTIRLSQSGSDDLKFENIKLVFESPCDGSISSQALISAAFTPSCSDITLQIDDRIVNSSTGTDLNIVLKDFDKSYKNFAGIVLQYKGVNELNWRLAKEFVLDSAKMNPSKGFIKIGSSDIKLNYKFPMKDEPDQSYMFRARTVCAGDIYNETPSITVIKDVKTPQSMGLPSPTNGIMTPESDISVTFNEKIQGEKIAASNVSVYGVLNDFTQTDEVGLQFNGAQQAFTESALNLQSGFTIEGKVLINTGNTNGTIFTLGEGADKVTVRAVSNGLKVLAGNDYSKTVSLTPDDGFQYIALSYDAATKYLSLMLWSNKNTDKTILFNEEVPNGIAPAGRLIMGDSFSGKLRQFSIWTEPRTYTVISGERSKSKTGNEINLVGYWPMDEGSGSMAADKARSRSLIVNNSSWFIIPGGLAALLDKTNQIVAKSYHIPVTRNEDLSVEFWFMGVANQPNTSLMSCTNHTDSIDDLQIGFNASGNLTVETMKNEFIIPSGDVLDSKWHHFALSVKRGGNAQVYIDGAMKYQTASVNFGAMASDSIAFGAKRKFANGAILSIFENRFDGAMDEIRLWRCALTGENIRLNKNNKLDGNELGLIAYYPFEKINSSNDVVFDNSDRYTPADTLLVNGGIFKGLDKSNATDNTPAIKPARKRVKVLSDFTASDYKLVININEDAARIENCILEFEVERIMDLNENRLASPIKWTAFVDMNRLKWENTGISLKKEVLAPQIFTAVVVNNSGKYEDFVISGLPAWLSVNKSQGTINPLEKITLTFTVDPSLNVGAYECAIRLTGSKNIDEVFGVSLKVTGPHPDWTVNPYDFESSMNVTGKIQIEGVYQEDAEDILAAFNGVKCVGIAHPVFNKTLNSYIVFMDIYGTTEDENKPLTFSLWDAGTGRIYPAVDMVGMTDGIRFNDGSIVKDVFNPQLFNATDKVEQQLSIKQGWTWISLNVLNTSPSLLTQFKSGMETSGLQLKSNNGQYINYSSDTWIGSLNALIQNTMYMVKATEAKTVKIIGTSAKPMNTRIPIAKNWNWIGYVPQFVAPLKEALSNLSANEGDQIKGQVGFATYIGGNWYGSLQYLTPGLGYMYYSKDGETVDKGFVYPSQYNTGSKVKQNAVSEDLHWIAVNTYQQTMTITGYVSLDNVRVTNADMQLGVFIGNECRGAVHLMYVEELNCYLAFLSVSGDPVTDNGKKLTIKCFIPSLNKELVEIGNNIDFQANAILGDPNYKLEFNSTTTGYSNSKFANNIYPNPVVNTLNFNYDPKEIDVLEIVDGTGRTQVLTTTINKGSIDVSNLMPGIYTLRVTSKSKTDTHRFMKK